MMLPRPTPGERCPLGLASVGLSDADGGCPKLEGDSRESTADTDLLANT